MVKKKTEGPKTKDLKITKAATVTNENNTNEEPKHVINENNFDALALEIQSQFGSHNNSSLFIADSTNLYDLFIEKISDECRQHYKCNACRQFLVKYGNIVKITDDGQTVPVLWNLVKSDQCTELASSISAINAELSDAKISGVFLSSDKNFGVESNTTKEGKIWTHFFVKNTNIFKNKLRSADQIMAEKKEDFKILMRSIGEFDQETARVAVELLSKDILFRAEKVLGVAQWFLNLHTKLNGIKNPIHKHNLVWVAVAAAPAGFCHIRSSMIGTLLEDISSKQHSLDEVKIRFADKMNPAKYQRPQSPPTTGNIVAAEKIVEKLGIANSLKRKFARLEDIQTIWIPTQYKKKEEIKDGVFAHLIPKSVSKSESDLLLDLSKSRRVINWEKFKKTILPDAVKIEVLIQSGRNSYGAFVTATDETAPPVLQWDLEEKRNPVSTYCYIGGSEPSRWNLKVSDYVNVTAIAFNPWMWFSEKFEHQGCGIIFVLENCKDTGHTTGGGLFPESLKSELREIRATIEAYTEKAEILEKDTATVCGLRFDKNASNRKPEEHILRVTDKNGVVSSYKLDRWD